ncbi:MAG: hypothetical protein IPO51_01240 [Dehalococcoidia bacterium]|nr:hypothetical protein [Dehalococcoidia bacterium]
MTGPNYWQRKYTRRGMLAKGATAGLGTAGFALVGCGGGDDDEEPLDLESIPTADATKQQEAKSILWPREDTTAKAVKGEIYQAYTTADVTNLDPLASPSFTANSAGSWYYPRLLSYKPGYKVPSNGEVQGYLGATWEQPEPTRVVFKLRPNAVWENKAPLNKRAIDAEDVVFSWNKFAAQNTSRKDLAKLPG